MLLFERHTLERPCFLVVVDVDDVGVVVAIIQREDDVPLIGAHGHYARVGGDDFGVAVVVGVVVDFHAVDAAAVLAFLFHVNDVVFDIFIKHPLLDVEG